MFKMECDELIQATKSLSYIRSLSPSNRRDALISRIEIFLSMSPFPPKEDKVLLDRNNSLLAELQVLESRILSLSDVDPVTEYVYIDRPALSFKQKILSLFLG